MTTRRFLTDQGFYVKTLTDDDGRVQTNVSCPVHCGRCCGYWKGTKTLRYLVNETNGSSPCPYLGGDGCTLSRDNRPIECTAYLCELAILAIKGLVSEDEIRLTLENQKQKSAFQFLGRKP